MTDQASPEGVAAPVETQTPPPAPEGAAPEAPKPAPQSEPEGQEPKGVAKRLKELTDARRAAEAREERLAKLLEETLRGRAPAQEPTQPERPKTLQDFGYDEAKYRDHLYTEARKEAEKAARDAGSKWKAEQDAIARRAKFDERVQEFAKSVDDYSDVVTPDTPVSEGMADAIMDSDEAGALMYYLGQNPDVARKLYYLTPAKAGREIQKIEDRLVVERKKAAEKPVSKAPPPAPTIEGSGDPGLTVDPASPDSDKLSDAEWAKRRARQIEKRRNK